MKWNVLPFFAVFVLPRNPSDGSMDIPLTCLTVRRQRDGKHASNPNHGASL